MCWVVRSQLELEYKIEALAPAQHCTMQNPFNPHRKNFLDSSASNTRLRNFDQEWGGTNEK